MVVTLAGVLFVLTVTWVVLQSLAVRMLRAGTGNGIQDMLDLLRLLKLLLLLRRRLLLICAERQLLKRGLLLGQLQERLWRLGLEVGLRPGSSGLLNLYYRPLRTTDYDALKAVHRDLFPIDYEEIFFRKAVVGEDRVFSWVAVHSEYGVEHLVGFVTARLVYLYECDPVDRTALGLASHALDGHSSVYVLTLGVVPGCRHCGVAKALLRLVGQHAARLRCRAIFLHVISYNDAAMRLYGGAGYQAMARLPNFYHLSTGRQPNPEQSWY
ncbi:hypothetical protein GPECTOR_22g901 [Gonium pectorale]|uniref:N-alpha-acetyltransferase 60 n=1 Tax=Gonium pectorale TaxID=33097 RepID=A0A150GHM0_GONPE|nr:hypothetical protein GPECTOR_22g901 [Gonium pectorale]|eukprot:KXZ49307.1 hypothetical protein GPECTOR_22g901 [Gonium pectorale]